MEKAQEVEAEKTVMPRALVAKPGISAKKLRALLKTEFPRQGGKSRRWDIPPDAAKKVGKKLEAGKAAKQAKINEKQEGE